ncbi:MAG: hypothetical protein FJZ47_03260, partial [Candidatus Tectomicrobia bacterium]|nr:hypothetical protein [Candidatus Tectomicrobia bacterium]
MTLHQPVHHLSPSVQPKGPDRTLIMPDGQTQVNSQRRARHGLAARLRRPGVRLLGLLLGCFGCVACTGGDDDKAANWVRDWHAVALHAIALDHTPVASGDPRVFGEQLGPLRTSRALAITHIAIFDVVNAIVGRYQSYTRLPPAPPDTSLKAAIAQAAHDTLVALFPSQAASLNERLRTSLAALQDRTGAAAGIELGQRAARAILAQRARDGAQHEEPRVGIEFLPGTAPGLWRPDPLSQGRLALGARWSEVTPFVLQSAAQFRLGPPPALTSPEYAAAFHEVQRLGGDGLLTPTLRTLEETVIGLFWAYDGTPGLGPPPRLYNQIALIIATQQGADVVQLAR